MKFNFARLFAAGSIALGLLMTQSVQATYSLSFNSSNYTGSHNSGSSSNYGSLIYQFNRNGSWGGVLGGSYACSSSLNTISYKGGDYGEGICLEVKDIWGRSYTWNICDWDGKEQIYCNFNTRYFKCDEIKIYGNCWNPCNPPPCNPPEIPTVPEPATVLAGALLLVPMGIQAARQFARRRKQD